MKIKYIQEIDYRGQKKKNEKVYKLKNVDRDLFIKL